LQFGFPVTTCCGDTPQDNTYTESWAEFFANRRLRFILGRSEKSNGKDAELRDLVEKTASQIVPRLIGDEHLNDGKGVTPVLVHGDLWSGNASKGVIGGKGQAQDVIFDSSACYAHNEYELGIMKIFGGFGGSFLQEYHKLVPKTEPAAEYEDRVSLYGLYHLLNHHVSRC
jgi:fructosamine-3-kinase